MESKKINKKQMIRNWFLPNFEMVKSCLFKILETLKSKQNKTKTIAIAIKPRTTTKNANKRMSNSIRIDITKIGYTRQNALKTLNMYNWN